MICVVTGAASGIGASLARKLAEFKPCILLLLDLDEDGLAEVESYCSNQGATVVTETVNVASEAEMLIIAERLLREHGVPDLIFANAGVLDPCEGRSCPQALAYSLDSNLLGVVSTTTVFLPSMIARQRGVVVVSSSIGALVATQSSGNYSASKSAVDAWTSAMRLRVRGSGVSFLQVVLGFVDTPMTQGLRHAGVLAVSPDSVAARMIRAALRRRRRVSIPRWRNLVWWGLWLLPAAAREACLNRAWRLFYGPSESLVDCVGCLGDRCRLASGARKGDI